ncbi:hypothetical protein [Nocardioides sp. NPDC004968]
MHAEVERDDLVGGVVLDQDLVVSSLADPGGGTVGSLVEGSED